MSGARQKDPVASFYKVPADIELCQKWLKVIVCKGWEPS